jgi:DNA-binding FrmR family transcriptional regulator
LRSVGRELVRNHMMHCATEAIRSDDPKRAEEMYTELLDMVYRLGR